jgi:hypothetical protein
MRALVTGVDGSGRSCVARVIELERPTTGLTQQTVYVTEESPPPGGAPGSGQQLDLGIAPGVVHWAVTHWAPHFEGGYNQTNTVDFDTVLAGSIDLILDDGVHELNTGDCVLVNGVAHAWRGGRDGGTLAVVLVGSDAKLDATIGGH